MGQVFFCEFCEISKNTFFTEHPWTTASRKIYIIFRSEFRTEYGYEPRADHVVFKIDQPYIKIFIIFDQNTQNFYIMQQIHLLNRK